MTNKEKYKKAFDVLASSEIISLEAENMMNKKQKKSIFAVTTAAAIVFGTLTVCAAAYFTWHNGLTESLQINEEQQKTLEDNGMAVFSEASCTDAGITVSAPLSITDNYYTYLSFKVEGYDLEKGSEPDFETIRVTVDGQDEFSWSGSFYDGLIAGPDGRVVYADGTPIDYEQPIEGHYVREDGSLEYHMVLAETSEKDYFVGKSIHVEFENLGTCEKAEYYPSVEGKWTLDWTLGGADTAKHFEMEETLGDTGCVVKGVEISPVSFYITCDFPRKEIIEECEMDDGTVETITTYETAPWASGVKLKDGTLLNNLYGGPGISGFLDDASDTYVMGYAFDRVINVDEVDSILFVKGTIDDIAAATEEDYYLVPLR